MRCKAVFNEQLVSVERKSEREKGRTGTYSYDPVRLSMNTRRTKSSMEYAIRSSPPAQSGSVASSRSLPDISWRAAIKNILLSTHDRSFASSSVELTDFPKYEEERKKKQGVLSFGSTSSSPPA